MQEKTFKQLLMSSNYYTLNKQIVKELGIESAFLLTILIEASDGLADDEGWFYQTIEKIGELTGLGRHKQDKIIKELIDLKILEQKNKGVPCKRYFKVNYEIIEIGEQPSVKVSQKALEAINSGLEEAKKGVFIDNDQVLEETDQLIEALAKKWTL